MCDYLISRFESFECEMTSEMHLVRQTRIRITYHGIRRQRPSETGKTGDTRRAMRLESAPELTIPGPGLSVETCGTIGLIKRRIRIRCRGLPKLLKLDSRGQSKRPSQRKEVWFQQGTSAV